LTREEGKFGFGKLAFLESNNKRRKKREREEGASGGRKRSRSPVGLDFPTMRGKGTDVHNLSCERGKGEEERSTTLRVVERKRREEEEGPWKPE